MPVYHANTGFPILDLATPADWDLLPALCRSFLNPRDSLRIRRYLEHTAKSVLVETDYIDKDYRDTFSNFYSKKFANYPSRTVRLHFFAVSIPEEDFWELERHNDAYIGYIIVRPTRINCIGRTILDPRKIKDLRGTMCLADFTVHVLGAKLSVKGFPFITQDTDVTVCAHAACWMAFRYFSERYSRYGEKWPHEITQLTANQSFGRLVPSRGVTLGQISEIFAGFGFSPEVYVREVLQEVFPTDLTLFDRMLYRYVESGIPVVAGLKNHAFTVFGHVSSYGAPTVSGGRPDSFQFVEGLVVNDDNHLPYQLVARRGHPSIKHPDGHALEDITAFVVPTYEKVHYLAEDTEESLYALLDSPQLGLQATKSTLAVQDVITRLFLTSTRSFKRDALRRVPVETARVYALLPMPKFIWVAELSNQVEYSRGRVVGEIIWDATANKYDPFSFIALHYPGLLVLNDRHALATTASGRIQTLRLPSASPYPVYRNNLHEVG
jgi:hypothetical protein